MRVAADYIVYLVFVLFDAAATTEIYTLSLHDALPIYCVAITGLSRKRIYLWHKNVVALPDREIVGGFFLRYVDVLPEGESARPADLEPAG
ncbi:MAG: hypothetical protein HKUEN07_34080 [Rhodocyclaceae bacterium]|nr:MAG: hypothetical protein HKUEN07_34080 [Rhodocyclaceae bacterium]